ncbi:aminotransferase class V-fold PLP-dependent enzyme [Amaricoccus solimangrovi]|uniref:Cysteine desulfurase n=1 Tax=Amaricoccus solimangrovi TaxID=2589815 RepID=A0A501WJL8_9RHOB|nr:cysteine desulfurase [Amaricoccus solimangrovi]TPE47327.1 cysteine desulfurase [Amaricoccus solimangrovi]
MYDVEAVRADFPILSREVDGHPLVYLDTASSAQKPRAVIEAIAETYENEYANVHRGLHYLSSLATERYESTREIVARFLGAASEEEIIFTSGATDAINLVSYAWAAPRLREGDEIVLSALEHHANIVPWHFLRERQGVRLRWVDLGEGGTLDPGAVLDAIGPRTRLVAVSHMSNVLGGLVDVAAICRGAAERGVPVLVDGSQTAAHTSVDVAAIGCDFYAITGHKLYGPSGSGALYARRERMAETRPFRGGGDMIRDVTREGVVYAGLPLRFEAGTPAIVPQIGLGVALRYLTRLGMEQVAAHERGLRAHARRRLSGIEGVSVWGADDSGPILSFEIAGLDARKIAVELDRLGIATRAGSFCSRPLLRTLGVGALCRASFGLYTTQAEVELFCDAVRDLARAAVAREALPGGSV